MPRLRTFIAIDPGKPIRDRLISLQKTIAKAGAQVKWVEPDNLHLTLLFLGEVDQREVLNICQAVADGCKKLEAFAMSVGGAGGFPNPRRPRTLWVGVSDGAEQVIAVHDALEPPLLELGCYRREERRYTPHITLGRAKGERDDQALSTELSKHADWHGGDTLVREVHVMSSELTADGPIYTVLSRAKLK